MIVKRAEILELMQQHAGRVAELGQAVEAALKAQPPTADDLGALLTAADITKRLADEFGAAVADAKGKEQRIAADFERGLRRWSAGARLLCDGLGGKPSVLTAMAQQWIEQGAQAMAKALKALA